VVTERADELPVHTTVRPTCHDRCELDTGELVRLAQQLAMLDADGLHIDLTMACTAVRS
jgi:hypothetical protein